MRPRIIPYSCGFSLLRPSRRFATSKYMSYTYIIDSMRVLGSFAGMKVVSFSSEKALSKAFFGIPTTFDPFHQGFSR
jgi:hypothetical protein